MHTEIEPVQADAGKKNLSVVLLCYNDEGTIGACVESAFELLAPITSTLQIIVVEDGSRDDSREVLNRLMEAYPTLEVLVHERNQGYGRSLTEGIRAALNQYVLCVDGDNQFDFKDAAKLLELADGRYEIISGCRRPRADPWYRRILGWIHNRSVRMVFDLPVQDVDCGFKLLDRRSALSLFPIRSNLAVWVEVMANAKRNKYRCANLVIHHRPRKSGKSTVFNFRSMMRMAWEIASLGARSGMLKMSGPVKSPRDCL
jgi:glycosyltransferase involved in cell wall biosynthesis